MLKKQKSKSRIHTIAALTLAAIITFALWFWDEAIFVAPVAAVTAVVGPFYGWIIMATCYFLLFFGLSIVTLNRFQQRRPGKLGDWVETQLARSKKGRLYPFVKSGTAGAIVASCFFLGGLITSHLVFRLKLWPATSMVTTAALCNFLFAIVWVGFYSGLLTIIFNMTKKLI